MEKTFKKKIQNKLKAKYVKQLLICESVLFTATIPFVILNSKPENVVIERNITKEGITDKKVEDNDKKENHLVIKTKWEQTEDGTFQRQAITYSLSNKTSAEIEQIINDEEILLTFVMNHNGKNEIEYKKVLTETEMQNNQLEVNGYVYVEDENYTHVYKLNNSEKILLGSISIFGVGLTGVISLNYDFLKRETRKTQREMLMDLTEEEIKEKEAKLNKCLNLARKKKFK